MPASIFGTSTIAATFSPGSIPTKLTIARPFAFRAATFAPPPLVGEVDERALQPAAERAGRKVALGKGLAQGFLGHVVGRMRIAQEVTCDAAQACGVAVQFSFEFVRIGHGMASGEPCYPCRGRRIGCRKV